MKNKKEPVPLYLLLGGDLEQRGDHLLVIPDQVPDVVRDLLTGHAEENEQ
jgi:hypothetical protein